MSKLRELFSYNELIDRYIATRMFSRSSPTPGVDGISFRGFDRNAGQQVRELSSQLLSKTYVHKSLRPFAIPKGGGGVRWICVPTHRDRLVQRTLQIEAVDLYYEELNTGISFGAFKKKATEPGVEATRLACSLKERFPHVVKSDIASFFDSISRSQAKREIRRVIRHRSLWWLFDQFIDTEIQCDSDMKKALERDGIREGVGVRQGMPLSPLIAHILLRDFDKFAAGLDAKVLRYVDDLLILAESAQKAEEAFNRCRKWLKCYREGLELPALGERKSEQYGPREAFEFLGVSIYLKTSGKWSRKIPDGVFEKIRSRVFEKVPDDFTECEAGSLVKAASYISSLREGYAAAYGGLDGWRHLERKLIELENCAIKRFSKSVSGWGRGPVTPLARRAFGLKPDKP